MMYNGSYGMKVKSESHEKVKIHIFPLIGQKIGMDEAFCDFLPPRWFLGPLDDV